MSAVSAAILIFFAASERDTSAEPRQVEGCGWARHAATASALPRAVFTHKTSWNPAFPASPPTRSPGPSWVHEIKQDGCRLTYAKRHSSWRHSFEGLVMATERQLQLDRAFRRALKELGPGVSTEFLICGGLGMDQSRSARNYRGGRGRQSPG
jgi:hypothetical protein